MLSRGKLRVPNRVELQGEHIAAFTVDRQDFRDVGVTRAILTRFTTIRTPEHALRFAQRYGLMAALKDFRDPLTATWDYSPDEKWSLEPISDWLSCAARLRRARDAIRSVRDDQMKIRARLKLAREIMHALKIDYLRVDLRPIPAWDQEREVWSVEIASFYDTSLVSRFSGALAAVLYHLIREARQPNHTAVCTLCGRDYSPARQPAASRANYCPTCRQKPATIREKWRRQKAAQRAKKGVE